MNKCIKVRLGDVTTVVSGSTPKTAISDYWDGEYNWVTPAEISDSTKVIYSTARKITAKAIRETSLNIMPVGTVLLSSRAPIGKVAITGKEMYCNQGFKNLICSNKIYNEYLFWFLKGKKEFLNSLGRGATFKEISKGIVENILVPLPVLETQIYIVENLNKVSEIISINKKRLEELDNLIKSIFYDMFGDPFEKENRNDAVYLEKVATIIMGQSPQGSTYNSSGDGTPLLNGPTEFGDVNPKEKQWTNAPTKMCKKGDILFCVRGATAGRMNIADKEYCIGRGLAAIRTTQSRHEYLYLYLEMMYDYFQRTSNGSTFINISKEQLTYLPIINIDEREQKEFSRMVKCIKEQIFLVKRSVEESENLFNRLMSQYFD